jgi:hypothetical protein
MELRNETSFAVVSNLFHCFPPCCIGCILKLITSHQPLRLWEMTEVSARNFPWKFFSTEVPAYGTTTAMRHKCLSTEDSLINGILQSHQHLYTEEMYSP